MWRRFVGTGTVCTLMVLSGAIAASAQDVGAIVRGRASGSDHAPLAGVRVTARAASLVGEMTTITSAKGDYVLMPLPPGAYVIAFDRGDLVPLRHTVRIDAGQHVVIDATLVRAREGHDAITVTIDNDRPERRAATVAVRDEELDLLPVGDAVRGALRLAAGPAALWPGSARLQVDQARLLYIAPDQLPPLRESIRQVAVGSSLPAEAGWLRAGSVAVVSRSGGDLVTGAIRATFGHASHDADVPADARRTLGIASAGEYVLGGPLDRGRAWFQLAALHSQQTVRDRTPLTHQILDRDDDRRFREVRLTHALGDAHRLRAHLLHARTGVEAGDDNGRLLDSRAFESRRRSDTTGWLAYEGVLARGLSVSVRYTDETAEDRGAVRGTTDLISRTPIVDQASGAAWWAPPCAGCGPDRARTRTWRLATSRLFSTAGASHQITLSYEGRQDRPRSGAFPADGLYRIHATGLILNPDSEVPAPILRTDGSTWIEWRPAAPADAEVLSHAIAASDRWQTRSLTLDLGVRVDRFETRRDGLAPMRDQAISPRVHISWMPHEHSRWLFSAGAARYVDVPVAPVRASFAGDGPRRVYRYAGPSINTAGTDRLDTASAIERALAWFFANGGSEITPLLVVPAEPGEEAREAARTIEVTVGVDRRLGIESYARASLFWQRFSAIPAWRFDPGETVVDEFGFVVDRADIATDRVERQNAGLTVEARYRLGIQAHAGASYTLARLWGNVHDAASGAGGPIADSAAGYRLEFDRAHIAPTGNLRADVRHRLRLWGRSDVLASDTLGTWSVALLYSFDSGQPYGAVGLIGLESDLVAAGYEQPPIAAPYAFTARDAFRGPGLARTDMALAWSRSVPGTVYSRVFVQFHLLNLFDRVRPIDPSLATVVETALTSPDRFARFDPRAVSPVRGEHWDLDPRWVAVNAAMTMSRTMRLSIGIRF